VSPEILLSLKAFAPELTLVFFLIVLFLMDGAFPSTRSSFAPLILIVVACASAAVVTCQISGQLSPSLAFSGMVANDTFSNFFRYLFFFASAISAYISFGSKELKGKNRMELSLLLLCVTFGLSLMAMASNLLILYIGIETVSIVSFVMAGFKREDVKSNEASFKYLVFGALASGVMIYGFSLVYGYTGSLQYQTIAKFLATPGATAPWAVSVAVVMVYVGLAYKIAAFPMHFWTPDVYEGSPTPIATFFSIGPKAAGFAALLRITLDILAVNTGNGQWKAIDGILVVKGIAIASAATMVVGNLSAMGQRNVKRMLAYSSIAHVGYMLMGLVSLSTVGLSAILFYLVAYCAMNIGAFWVVSIVSDLKDSEDLEAFRGLGWQMPVLGVCMAIFLFSLTGIPLFAGFIGKFLIFSSVLNTPGFLWLALLGVLNSVVSLYYYTKILKSLWLERPVQPASLALSWYDGIGLIGLATPTVVLGLYFTPVIHFAEASLAAIL
jgi:NADH-quinone oxidoreductase subunit N